MLKNKLFTVGAGFILSISLSGVVSAQQTTTVTTTTTKEAVKNPDGTWTVIEYPADKEVVLDLTPYGVTGKGVAKVMRMSDGTTVNLDLNGIDANTKNYHVYAVDSTGATTYLGPVMSENGMGKATFKTPLNNFMLVLSPTEGVTSFDDKTTVVYRSAVPQGYAVVNNRATTSTTEKQVAETAPVASTYDVPLLGVSSFKKGETELRVNFSGELQGLKAKAYIDNKNSNLTKIKVRFDDMKMAPKEKRYVLWAVSPTKEYTKIGQVINNGDRQESEIRGETALTDFGLFVTVEDKDVMSPTSTVYVPVTVVK